MSLKIERQYSNFKVTHIGARYNVIATDDELLQAVAHYWQLKAHQSDKCPTCKDIQRRAKKGK